MPDSSAVKYRGAIRSAVPSSGSTSRNTVNVVSIENYVRGVIAAEMPSSWMPEALKAQAVAARTYGVRSITTARYYDICSTTACQVYGGASRETASTDAAVAGTNGKILTVRRQDRVHAVLVVLGRLQRAGQPDVPQGRERSVGRLGGQRQPRVEHDGLGGDDREGVSGDRHAQAAQGDQAQRLRRLGRAGQHDQPGGLGQGRHDLRATRAMGLRPQVQLVQVRSSVPRRRRYARLPRPRVRVERMRPFISGTIAALVPRPRCSCRPRPPKTLPPSPRPSPSTSARRACRPSPTPWPRPPSRPTTTRPTRRAAPGQATDDFGLVGVTWDARLRRQGHDGPGAGAHGRCVGRLGGARGRDDEGEGGRDGTEPWWAGSADGVGRTGDEPERRSGPPASRSSRSIPARRRAACDHRQLRLLLGEPDGAVTQSSPTAHPGSTPQAGRSSRVPRGAPGRTPTATRRAPRNETLGVNVHHTAGSNSYSKSQSASDRPRHPGVSHEGPRLVRHRLQLPGRQVRPDLRGPGRRRRPAGPRLARRQQDGQHATRWASR